MDKYSIYARVYPVILVLLPITVIGVSLSIDIVQYYNIATTVGITIGFSLLFSNISREFGKKKEKKLWEKWGGAPTSTILRQEDETIDSLTKKKVYLTMKELIPESSAILKRNEPSEVSELYVSWTKYLNKKTSDSKKFPLIFKENINYAFRRNM
jgi:hypothetical protein